ncbi:MAG: hypothetical protein KAR47_13545, partial [Planctomycetes bacterium]|nr:hypothetical protein [Planctomycetota bacterium]
VLGRGGVVGSDRDVCFFSCLGSLCIIAYSLAWTITGTSTVVLLIRIALFVFVVLVLILILSALALFSYSTVGIDDRLSVLALIVYLRKLLKSRDP